MPQGGSKTAKGGPKTTKGKAAVTVNAISYGITSVMPVVPTLERVDEWEAHRTGVLASLQPEGHLEMVLAERVALLLWRLRRVTRYETEAITLAQETIEDDLAQCNQFRLSLQSEVPSPGETRQALEVAQGEAWLLEHFPLFPAEHHLSSIEAATLLHAVADAGSVEVFELEFPGVPEDADFEAVTGWTAGRVHQCIEVIATQAGQASAELVEQAHEQAKLAVTEAERQLAEAEQTVGRMRRERILPDDATLAKVQHYEGHLSRQLFATLHELEAMQERRLGRQTPLARLDVSGLEA